MKARPILLAWFHDYHIFGFVEYIIPSLCKAGYDVTLLTCDEKLVQKYKALDYSNFEISYHPYLRPALRGIENRFLRAFLWCFGWCWSFWITRSYDVVLAPRDTTPFYHMVTSWTKSVICRPALGFQDKTYIQHKFDSGIDFPDAMQFIKGKFPLTDKLFSGNYLEKMRGPKDKKYYTVQGEWIAEFLQKTEVPQDHIFVTGNFNYEGISPENIDASVIQGQYFKDVNAEVYTFFSSQQYFGELEFSALYKIIKAVKENDGCFVIKVHPKLDREQKKGLENWAKDNFPEVVRIISDLSGDYNNACLVSLSKAVLIEESNVGILAMHFDKPLIIIDLGGKKDSQSNIFKLFDGILVSHNLENFLQTLDVLEDKNAMKGVMSAQKEFVRFVCVCEPSPCANLLNLLNKILLLER